jgi:hypothetical protein
VISAGASSIEPRTFISVPVTCYAIKEGWIDKESLIFQKRRPEYSLIKPLDILRQQDEDGIKQILKTIGKSRLTEFLESRA